jgi:hypothetical protein
MPSTEYCAVPRAFLRALWGTDTRADVSPRVLISEAIALPHAAADAVFDVDPITAPKLVAFPEA